MAIPNFDATQVGVPYPRVDRVEITYPKPLHAEIILHQSLAVKLADGSIVQLKKLDTLKIELAPEDMPVPYPLVHPDTGASLGQNGTAMQCYLLMLGLIRKKQLEVAAASQAAE